MQSPLSGESPCNDKDSSYHENESDTFSPPQGSVKENEVDLEPDKEQDGEQEESMSIDKYDCILVELVSSFNFPRWIDYFLGGEPITTSSQDSVELAVLCEAGHIFKNDQVATATKCAEILVAEYKNVITSISRDLFISASLRDDMKMKMKSGQKNGFKAKTLWEKCRATQTEMKNIFANLPDNYHTMKSGQQLYNVHEKVIRDYYKAD